MSGVFENQDAAVVQMDFRGFPRLSLVEPVWVRLMGIPGTVEPVEVGFVVGDPFLDRLPGWLDGLHGLDVEGRWWRAGELDDALPKPVETEEEFDLLGAFHGTGEFHRCFAARALERVGSPYFEDEVTPEGAHGTGALFWRGGDEEDFRLGILDFRLMIVDYGL